MTEFDEWERRAWSGRAEAYAASFGKLCAYPVPMLLDAGGVGAGVRVLDVGTGPGTVAAAALGRGAIVTAVDADPGMVELASQVAPGAAVQVAVLPMLPFEDDEFDSVVGNFVLNHLGRPVVALAELRRVTRPGGRIALTVWAVPGGTGQTVFGQAIEAAGIVLPVLPSPSPEDNFRRDEPGVRALLAAAGLREGECRAVSWDHRASVEEWWSGPAAGVASVGQFLLTQSAQVRAEVREHFDRVAVAGFAGADGLLALPHRALLAAAVV